MFNDIGKKIKGFAKVIYYLGMIGSVIGGIGFITTMADNTDEEMVPMIVLIGLVIAFIGSVISWLGSLFTYGFGELIDKTTQIENHISHSSANGFSPNSNGSNPNPNGFGSNSGSTPPPFGNF